MNNFQRVPVTEEDKLKSYYKYFNRELVDIPEEKKKILEHPLLPDGAGLELADRNKIFDPGYLPDEIGVSHLKSGGYCFSNQNFIPPWNRRNASVVVRMASAG